MLYLLNAVSNIRDSFYWMLVALGIFLIVEIAIFAIIMLYRKHKAPAEKPRQAISITLDTQVVKRDFRVGEKFDSSGLIVTVHYNDEPYEQTLQDFVIVTHELIKKLEREGKTPDDLLGCRIYEPDLSVAGKPVVTVNYMGQIAAYAISVTESEAKPAPQPEVIREVVEVIREVAAEPERVAEHQPAVVVVPAVEEAAVAEPEVETVDYVIVVDAPKELDALQVALYNGADQVGDAVNVNEGSAVIAAPAGNYAVKVFGIYADDYEVNSGLLSATKRYATVTITCNEAEEEVEEEEIEEEVAPEQAATEEEEPIDYVITVVAPENMSMQAALVNGIVQAGGAVNVRDGAAIISAPAGEYYTKIFCLPEGYEATVELVSENKRHATVYVTQNEDYEEDEIETEVEEEFAEEEEVPTVSEVVEAEPEAEPAPELTYYNIIVTAPEGLSGLQVALYNGDIRVGDAANVESGAATVAAEEGEYAVRIFGVPEGYEVSEGTVSATRHICTVTVKAPVQEEAVEEPQPVEEVQPAEPMVIVEESLEGGILRYDRSFTARLIQSDNEIKDWYTDLKNDLLSYKKVKDRMSWKRESYNFGRQAFARLAYRGDTLCLYLPLDPQTLADSKYKVESVADNATYIDTPCLYRIKNNKRVKYAKELIATTAELLGVVRIERESQDYYLPYEGLVELINKGLVKRNIKSKAEEAIFVAKTEN